MAAPELRAGEQKLEGKLLVLLLLLGEGRPDELEERIRSWKVRPGPCGDRCGEECEEDAPVEGWRRKSPGYVMPFEDSCCC